MREMMSKWNYVIGVRELISGDRCLRRSRGSSENKIAKMKEKSMW